MSKTAKSLFSSLFAVIGLLVSTNFPSFGQSNVNVIDTIETAGVSASTTQPNIRVTESGAVNVGAGPAIDLGNFSGSLIVEKGNSAATGLVKANDTAISATMTTEKTARSIVNYAEISGTTAVDNGASVAKTFLFFTNYGKLTGDYLGGAGTDRVYLMQGSTTQGDINLGAGNNVFEIGRGVTLTGSVSGGGNDAYTLYGNSLITGSLAGNSGDSALYLDPVAGMQATVQGNVDFKGVIFTTLQKTPGANSFNASQLFVGGNANWNGSTIVIESLAGTGTLAQGDAFLVLSAGGTLSGIPTTVAPTGSEMLTFGVSNGLNDVYVTVTNRENFADHVNENDRLFASAIDAMIDNHAMTSKSLDRIFGELQLGTKADTRRFFAGGNPSQFLSLPVSGMQTTQQMTFGIVDRLSVLRERMGRRPTYVPNYYYGQSCDGYRSSSQNRDVFVRAFGGYHKEDPTSDHLGYRSTSQGIQIGFDKRIGSRAFVGVSLGYADIGVKIRETANSADDLMLRFGGYYTRMFDNGVFFDGEVTYGHHDNKLDRYYSIANVGGRAVQSKYQAHDIASYVGLGRKFVGRDTFYLTPLVSAQHIYYRQEAFEERGQYGLYHFDRQGLNSVNLRAAVRLGQERWGGKNMGFEFEAGYNVELGDDIRVTGGWIGGPVDMFTMTRPSATENGFYGAWKLNVRPSEHCQLFGRYLGEGSKGGFSHGAEFGGIWMF